MDSTYQHHVSASSDGTMTTHAPLQFQYVSDLHLEFRKEYATFTIPRAAPNLVLAGDIGNLAQYDAYLAFLAAHTDVFDRIFLVLGNHDFYGATLDTGFDAARRLTADPRLGGRVVLLHQRRWDDPGSAVTVLGCTLWSHIPPESVARVTTYVPDYKRIDGWSVDANNAAHASDVAWLREQLAALRAEAPERKVVVVSHHAPALRGTSKPMYEGSPVSAAFATDLAGTEDFAGVTAWIFGHTHYITTFETAGVTIMANARGYPGENILIEKAETEEEKRHAFDITRVMSAAT